MVLPCAVEQRNPSPYGVYLKRSWLHPSEVLFMYTKSEFTTTNSDDKNRTSVSGDPSNHSLKVTISQLRVSDTDRYYCEFIVNNPLSEDERIQGTTEFFLLVNAGECFISPHTLLTCCALEIKLFKNTARNHMTRSQNISAGGGWYLRFWFGAVVSSF